MWPSYSQSAESEGAPKQQNRSIAYLAAIPNCSFYISSFRLSQRDVFESVKRVTGTTNVDWTITHESVKHHRKDGRAALQHGDRYVGINENTLQPYVLPQWRWRLPVEPGTPQQPIWFATRRIRRVHGYRHSYGREWRSITVTIKCDASGIVIKAGQVLWLDIALTTCRPPLISWSFGQIT